MFLLYRVYSNKRHGGTDKQIIEDGLSTLDECREAAEQAGPGHYIVMSLRRMPGRRIVSRFTILAPSREHAFA